MKTKFKLLLTLSIVISSFTFISCDKNDDTLNDTQACEEQFLSATTDLCGDDIYLVPEDESTLTMVEGTFSVGMNYVNGHNIAIYPDLFSEDPIETEVWQGEKVRLSDEVELPNGTTMTNCPKKGTDCGLVWWRSDELGSNREWKFIGYYD